MWSTVAELGARLGNSDSLEAPQRRDVLGSAARAEPNLTTATHTPLPTSFPRDAPPRCARRVDERPLPILTSPGFLRHQQPRWRTKHQITTVTLAGQLPPSEHATRPAAHFHRTERVSKEIQHYQQSVTGGVLAYQTGLQPDHGCA